MHVYPVKTVLVDDEPVILQTIRTLVEKQQQFRIIATAASVKEALAIIPGMQPQLLLLDIDLPDGTGFDILQQLHPASFKVIFITAYKEFAIKAIKYGALDYVLKPVDELELTAALAKTHEALSVSHEQVALATNEYHFTGTGRLAIREGLFLRIINMQDILYIQSADGLTSFHLQDGRMISTHKIIKEYEEMLPPELFFRCHQSYLVNTTHIDSYHRDGILFLHSGVQLPVSVRKKELVMEFLSKR